jgi:hypothetical protein
MVGNLVTSLAARAVPEREICANGCAGWPTKSDCWSAPTGPTVARSWRYTMAMPVLSMLLASPISPPMAATLLGGQVSASWAGQMVSRHGLRGRTGGTNALDELRGPDAQYMRHPESKSQGGRVGAHVNGWRQAVGFQEPLDMGHAPVLGEVLR